MVGTAATVAQVPFAGSGFAVFVCQVIAAAEPADPAVSQMNAPPVATKFDADELSSTGSETTLAAKDVAVGATTKTIGTFVSCGAGVIQVMVRPETVQLALALVTIGVGTVRV